MKDFHGSVESFNVKQVDTTGAGDAFIGALLGKIIENRSALQVTDLLSLVGKFATGRCIYIIAQSMLYCCRTSKS